MSSCTVGPCANERIELDGQHLKIPALGIPASLDSALLHLFFLPLPLKLVDMRFDHFFRLFGRGTDDRCRRRVDDEVPKLESAHTDEREQRTQRLNKRTLSKHSSTFADCDRCASDERTRLLEDSA